LATARRPPSHDDRIGLRPHLTYMPVSKKLIAEAMPSAIM
jgi:hypothetical protein